MVGKGSTAEVPSCEIGAVITGGRGRSTDSHNSISERARVGGVLTVGSLIFAFFLTSSFGQAPMVSQTVGVATPIVNEFGRMLKGTESAADEFSLPVVEGDLVQILQATDGAIYPPDTSGQPHSNNVVLVNTRIGQGMSPGLPESGKFGFQLSPRPGGNSRIFVRVFNAATLDEASFYADSELFTVKSWKNEVFLADITATTIPLDVNDTDGDGLQNSWERSYGTDASVADTDQDGFTDAEEVLAGTDVLDAESFLGIERAYREGHALVLQWVSTAGRTYRVEFTPTAFWEHPAYEEVGVVVASGGVTQYSIPNGLQGQQGCYRVRVVP